MDRVLHIIAERLERIESLQKTAIRLDARVINLEYRIFTIERKIMSALSDLQDAVAAEDTVIDSAIVLIQGIPALIAAAGTDPAALKALQDDIAARSTALAAAVTANTPVPPPAP